MEEWGDFFSKTFFFISEKRTLYTRVDWTGRKNEIIKKKKTRKNDVWKIEKQISVRSWYYIRSKLRWRCGALFPRHTTTTTTLAINITYVMSRNPWRHSTHLYSPQKKGADDFELNAPLYGVQTLFPRI